MAKLIILSVVLISFALPIYVSKSARPRAALRRTQFVVLGFIVIWALMCTRWYPELVPLK
jgi:hypothetical protein